MHRHAPAIATPTEDVQAFFAECDRASYFEDRIDLFQASFTVAEEPAVMNPRIECGGLQGGQVPICKPWT